MLDNIFYIHGFGSSSDSTKGNYIRDLCKELNINFIGIDYDTSADYVTVMEQIVEQMKPHLSFPIETGLMIGSSLGGYWAIKLANRFIMPCLLLNPSLNPRESLKKYEAINKNNVSSYKDSSVPNYGCVALFESGDEVIDYRDALEELKDHGRMVIIPGGSHQFENLHIIRDEIIRINNSGIVE